VGADRHFQNLTIVDYYNSHVAGTSNELSNYNPGNAVVKAVRNRVPTAFLRQQALGPRATTSETLGLDRIEAWGIADIATWDISDNVTFRTILGYRSFKQLNRFDYDGSSLTFLGFDACATPAQCHTSSPGAPWTVNVEQFTRRAAASGKLFDGKLDYTIGLSCRTRIRPMRTTTTNPASLAA